MTENESDAVRTAVMERILADPNVEFGQPCEKVVGGVSGIWMSIDETEVFLGPSIAAAQRTADVCDWWVLERDGNLSSDDLKWLERRAELGDRWKQDELPLFREERRRRLALNIGTATDAEVHSKPMGLVIHRGASEVGGSCVELDCQGCRLIIDVGMPLFASDREPLDSFRLRRAPKAELVAKGIVPNIPGLFTEGPPPDAILLSHAHLDHTGLLGHSHPNVPVYASRGTSKMMLAGALFAAQVGLPQDRFEEVTPGEPFVVGPFRVTAFSVDHSIYGCIAFLIEAEGKSVLYSGDLRLHGRKPGMMNRLIEKLRGRAIDVMLMEGTHYGFPDGPESTEYELEKDILDEVRSAERLVLMSFSPQHVDRLVAFLRSAKASGRTFVADIYTSFILHLLSGELAIPKPKKDGLVRTYVPKSLRSGRKRRGIEKIIARFQASEITLEEILREPSQYAMVFRPSMASDFGERMPQGCTCLCSSWPGYLNKTDWQTTRSRIEASGGKLVTVHTTGHIRSADIAQFVKLIEPKTVIPIHTFEPERFSQELENVAVLRDGERFEI